MLHSTDEASLLAKYSSASVSKAGITGTRDMSFNSYPGLKHIPVDITIGKMHLSFTMFLKKTKTLAFQNYRSFVILLASAGITRNLFKTIYTISEQSATQPSEQKSS